MGARIADDVEVTTNLLDSGSWMPLATYTNAIPSDAAAFDTGWTEIPFDLSGASVTNAPVAFFRFLRHWLPLDP